MNDLLVTVLIPTHNHGDLIEFPLRTRLDQTRQEFEVLVVGDGMTDEGLVGVRIDKLGRSRA